VQIMKRSKNKGGAESDSGPGAQSTREVHAKNQPVNQKKIPIRRETRVHRTGQRHRRQISFK
jgi:hypothetical protein